MNKQTTTYQYKGTLVLESGKIISDFPLTYTTLGEMNKEKDNVVWIFHAMTANSDPTDWWEGLVGEGKFFTPEQYFIICVNIPGSHYGSVGPLTTNPETGLPYYHTFPFFTPLDMVRAYDQLRLSLGIEKIYLGIGGSMGGQQLLSWACEQPYLFRFIVPIATNAFHSPWGKAFNASKRMCIEADQTWKESSPSAGIEGMKVARSIALISYRNYDIYNKLQQDNTETLEHTRSESYLKYQGEKLAKRFNAFSYYFLTKSIDSHHLGRGKLNASERLGTIKSIALVIGISSDILYPTEEQKFIANRIPNAELAIIDSSFGHDGFLLEAEKLTNLLTEFINKNKTI